VARRLVLSGARDSRAQRGPRRGTTFTHCVRGPRDAEPVISPVAFRPPACGFFFSDDWLRHARSGEPQSAAAPLGLFLRFTGLPSRSALVAPPLRLAALRWCATFVVLGAYRPPPGVSTACLVAVTHCPAAPFPGEPHTVLCPSKLEGWRHNAVYCTPAVARCRVLSGARDSRALRSSRRAHRWEARLGVHGTRSQSVRRLRFGRRPDFPSSAMTGSATTFPEKQGQAPDGEERYLCQMSVPVAWTDSGAGQWLWSGQNVVTLRLGGPDAR
jgi:hypothetical protein